MIQYAVVIPSKNLSNLIACVSAIRTNGENCRIIVVDDSEVGFPPIGDGIEVIHGVRPFVFSKNVNLGIRHAGDLDIVCQNDDCLLKTPLGFALLRQQSVEHPDFGAISPGFNLGGARHMNLVNQGRPHLATEPIMLIFAACYIPRSTIDRVGLLDERFGINAGGPGARGYGLEDDDYSLRIRKTGLKLGVYDGVKVDHTTLKSTFRDDPEHKADVRIHERLFREIHGHWPEGHGYQ